MGGADLVVRVTPDQDQQLVVRVKSYGATRPFIHSNKSQSRPFTTVGGFVMGKPKVGKGIQETAPVKKKKDCPITRKQFKEHAKQVALQAFGTALASNARTFSTGSLGWYFTGKGSILIDGQVCEVQLGFTATIVGSKELPPE